MDIKKAILYIIVVVLAIAIFNNWMSNYPPTFKQHTKSVGVKLNRKTSTDYTSPMFTLGDIVENTGRKADSPILNQEKISGEYLVTIKTDVLELSIDTHGGNIVSAKLLKYPVSLEEKQNPIQILSNDTNRLYIAQSSLMNSNREVPIYYKAQKSQYELVNNQNELIVQLIGQTSNGLHIIKTYTFHRGDYAIQITYQVHNATKKLWKGNLYTQITWREPLVKHHHFYVRSYNGAAISSQQIPYEKISYKAMDKHDINRASQNVWVAVQQHYFLSAWIPGNPDLTYHYYSHAIPSRTGNSTLYVIGFMSPQISIASGKTAASHAVFYIGPEIVKQLKALAPNLDRTIDYGWLWPISTLLFWIMSAIHAPIKNWGWTIILTTIFIKIVFYWFSAKSFRSIARMREMQPHLQALKERYGDDRQILSRTTMDLYRKEKINPLGGCLPMLIQVPVFIAFYYVIIESVELRQAPFILWIHDLSAKDPYYILPILMGFSMLLQQWLSPTSPDLTQQKMIWILPIVFTIFFINFPAGLVLYWLSNNVVQTLQQWYVNKTYENHKVKLKIRREGKKK